MNKLTLSPDQYNLMIKSILGHYTGYSYLRSDNILFRLINGKLIGKRAIDTINTGIRWKEEIKSDSEVYKWLHPVDADYNEIFIIESNSTKR